MTICRNDFPDDDDGDVLFRLAREGIDLTRKRAIDFSCYAKSEEAAQSIVDDLSTYGYDTTVFVDDGGGDTGKVSVYARIFMRPDHTLLLVEQKRLDAILRFHDTFCDGWLTQSK